MTRPDESLPRRAAGPNHPSRVTPPGMGPARLALVGLLAAAALVLLFEHRVHVLGVLPWLLVLACPLMHLFGHRTHGAHSGHLRQVSADRRTDVPGDATAQAAGEVRGWRAPSPWTRPPGPSTGRGARPLEEMPTEATRPPRSWRRP